MSSSSPKWFLTRHGETEWNRIGRRQGQLDSPLIQAGLRHAEAIASICDGLEIDRVFSSPLGRALETANMVASKINCPVEVVHELAEVHHGTFAGLTNDEIEAAHPGALQQRRLEKYTWRFPGGESYADAEARAKSALKKITASGARRPLLVAHEMIGRTLLRSLLDLPAAEVLSVSIPHGTVIEIAPTETVHRWSIIS